VEKSSEDACVGSLPFDYSLISNSGFAPDVGSHEPTPDLIPEPPDHDEEVRQKINQMLIEESRRVFPHKPVRQMVRRVEQDLTVFIPNPASPKHFPNDQTPIPGVAEESISIPHEQEIRQEMQTTTIPKTSLVKHNQVKALALELMADRFTFNGEPKFTRVSETFTDAVERFLYTAIAAAIRRHPSTGKIIKEF
jgi:hypothetical protein